MSENEFKVFEELAKPLIEWLNKNKNPHSMIIIDSTSAEVVDGAHGFFTDEYLKD
jgi:hypothetical protein